MSGFVIQKAPLRHSVVFFRCLNAIRPVRSTARACNVRYESRLQARASRLQIMAASTEAKVGEWVSPITSKTITSSVIGLGGARASKDGYVYYVERRPTEKGRTVIMRQKPDAQDAEQLTPPPESGLNPRTRVQEYGGGEITYGDGVLYFSNFADQRLYKQTLSPSVQEPEPLSAADTGLRFADGIVDQQRNRVIVVQEDHSKGGEPVNTIAAVDLNTGASTVLASGNDFYSNPALSLDGKRLAWITWNHPNMPWDDTELWIGELDDAGSVQSSRKVAGGKDESVLQPTFTPQGELIFISDRGEGWWNLYKEDAQKSIKALFPRPAEFALPAWVFGIRTYALLSNGKILTQYSDPKDLGATLAVIDPESGSSEKVETPFAFLGSLSVAEAGGKFILTSAGGSPTQPSVITALVLDSVDDLPSAKADQWRILKKSSTDVVDGGYLSKPQTIEFPTEGGLTAFLNYYPPHNKDFHLPESEKPPLLIKIHGGPTSQASTGFNLLYQYWTSRGFAIADVNYGGSTGYGRAYRNRLKGNWGVVDVADCANAAKYLAEQGKADSKRLTIDGGSAGGYTTLAALAFTKVFSAGASYFGVADCELLAQETHKFESRYLDGLIGPYPETKDVYKKRSPINSVDKFSSPIILFQGLEDKVVPPNQATEIYEKLKEKGLVTALVLFEGEQHGFRGTDAIRRALDGQLYFYGKALGFQSEMPSDLPAPEIVNL